MTAFYISIALLITLPITGYRYYSSNNLPGALLCLFIAVPAWFLGRLLPLAGGAVIGILLGMMISQFWRLPDALKPGIKETGKRMLQAAIVLLGFQMNLTQVLGTGSQVLVLLLAVIAVALVLAQLIGKSLGLKANEQILIGVGTAICGGAAIAAASPIIKADEKQVTTAISVVFFFNIVAVFVFPAVGHLFGMDDLRFGMWAGAAINDTSSVVAAGFTYSEDAGNIATVVKMTRTLMIIPITFILALIQSKKAQGGDGFSLSKTFPWFIAGFLAACMLNTAGVIPEQAAEFWGVMSRFLIVIAMAGIGLGTNLKTLIRRSKKPLLLGFCLSLAVASVSLFLMSI